MQANLRLSLDLLLKTTEKGGKALGQQVERDLTNERCHQIFNLTKNILIYSEKISFHPNFSKYLYMYRYEKIHCIPENSIRNLVLIRIGNLIKMYMFGIQSNIVNPV